MSNKGLGGKGLSDKEAALLAAARRELARPTAAPPGAKQAAQIAIPAVPRATRAATGPVTPLPPADKPEYAVPADPPPVPDIATRMALLMDAQRRQNESRKQRVKRAYVIIVTAVMVPSFLYVFITMFKLLAR